MNKIAIIEDDIDICNMIAKFLENNKYIVHYALNGAEGIELCKSLVPDLIILDIMLPKLNGNDVLQRLRKFTNAPVIVVSAKTMVQTKIDLLKLGADDYMTKPFDLHELLARIEANLKRTSKQEQGQCIKIIKAKTDYLTDLVQEFYDLSVIENEQVDVECERVDINRIVTDCLIEKYYEFGEIQPTIQTENTPVWIYGNNLICKRIIENLIVNALRYSDNYIEVSINQKGVFTIKNSTKSLDDIDVNLLFNKFYTVDKSRTKGSSGLGLYIVKELLKKIDGKIENVSYEKNILSISICFPLYNDKKLL